jgi:o-succinylbenzoate synthase
VKLSVRHFSGSTCAGSSSGGAYGTKAAVNMGGAKNARRAWPTRSGLIVELCTGSSRGLGEASPLPGFSSDTLEGAATALGSIDMTALERTLDIEDIGAALKAVAGLLTRGQPAARMALETAALDLRGQQSGVSAPELLGADPGAARMLAWLVDAPRTQLVEAVQDAQQAGYGHFKIKLGAAGSVEPQIARMRELRLALGPNPQLRLDINRGWSIAEARTACTALEALDIEFIEEPCRRLKRPLGTRIPMALDESLQGLDPDDLAILASRSGAGVVVLKPMVLGGLSHCLELGRRAAALDLGVVVSHSFDGPVALAAAAALALALPTRLAQGLAPHSGLAAWPTVPLPIADAALHVWSTPGLGVTAEGFK